MNPILLIVLGLGLLVIGGEALVRGASMLARRLGVSPAVIGLTVVALGTSVPELVVSILAAMRGAPDLAVGNVVGSNIVNLTASLGIAALVGHLSVRGQVIKLEWPVLFIATAVTLGFLRDASLDRLEGGILVAGLAVFIAYTVYIARGDVTPTESVELEEEVAGRLRFASARPNLVAGAFIFVGIGALVLGGDWVVDGAVTLARALGMTDRVIGLTIVAIGTGLPELVTSVVASFRRESDIAVANLVGSCIFNLLGILGASALVLPFTFDPSLAGTDLIWLLGITIGIWPILHSGRVVNRLEGGLLVAVYGVYVTTLLM